MECFVFACGKARVQDPMKIEVKIYTNRRGTIEVGKLLSAFWASQGKSRGPEILIPVYSSGMSRVPPHMNMNVHSVFALPWKNISGLTFSYTERMPKNGRLNFRLKPQNFRIPSHRQIQNYRLSPLYFIVFFHSCSNDTIEISSADSFTH